MSNTSLWATEREEDTFDIGCPVIKWDDEGGMNLLKTGKFINTWTKTLEDLQPKVKQFTCHWAVTRSAQVTYNVLKARGLSCNFSIDDDCNEEGFATIYQHLPMNRFGYSQGKVHGVSFNRLGVGVELAYMPQAWEKKQYSDDSHPIVKAPIHGTKLSVHLPSEAQMKSLASLIWGFSELFPDVPATFPRKDGEHLSTVLMGASKYTGLLQHYHIKRGKLDAAGMDMEWLESQVEEMKAVGYNIFRNL